MDFHPQEANLRPKEQLDLTVGSEVLVLLPSGSFVSLLSAGLMVEYSQWNHFFCSFSALVFNDILLTAMNDITAHLL